MKIRTQSGNEVFGRNLADIMYERHVSQADLCDALGVSQATISMWVRGERMPRSDRIDTLAEYLRVSVDDFWRPRRSITLKTDKPTALSESERIADTLAKSPSHLALVKAILELTGTELGELLDAYPRLNNLYNENLNEL